MSKKQFVNMKQGRRIIQPMSLEREVFQFIRYFGIIELGTSASNIVNQHFKTQMLKYKKIHPELDFNNMVFSNAADGSFRKALRYGAITEEEFAEATKIVAENGVGTAGVSFIMDSIENLDDSEEVNEEVNEETNEETNEEENVKGE